MGYVRGLGDERIISFQPTNKTKKIGKYNLAIAPFTNFSFR